MKTSIDEPIGQGNTVRLVGKVRMIHKRAGKVLSDRTYENLVVNLAEVLTANFWIGAAPVAANWAAFGDGNTPPDATDVDLENEVTPASRQVAASRTVLGNQAEFVFLITAGSTFDVEEVGLFNDVSAAGKLIARFLSTAFTMVAADTLVFTWTIGFTGETLCHKGFLTRILKLS